MELGTNDGTSAERVELVSVDDDDDDDDDDVIVVVVDVVVD